MRRTALLLVLSLSLLLVASAAPAAAQPQINESDAVDEATDVLEDDESCDRRISSDLRLCSKELDGSRAVLVFESDRTQTITLTDSGAAVTGGSANKQTFTVDDRTEIAYRVTVLERTAGLREFAGVGVDYGPDAYFIVLEDDDPIISGPYDRNDLIGAGLGVGLGISAAVAYAVVAASLGIGRGPERLS